VTEKPLNVEVKLNLLLPEQEISMGPPLWLWDYLRRSGARGFFLPLSGGADSASVAGMVASMADMVFQSIKNGNTSALADLRKIVRDDNFIPEKY
jgi:NAD+ synthase (glutamine-hydrolysing)